METQSLEKIVREHPFFEGMREEHIAVLTGCAKNVRFEVGEFLLKEGEDARVLYLLRAGKVGIEAHVPGKGAMQVGRVGEGDVLGWSWLVQPYRWHFDARAVEVTRALELDGTCLREKFEKDHELGYEVLKRFVAVIAQRLEWTHMQVLDVYRNG
ncbi:MAG: cyclic nucleotide-binding domain-containing protein [Planctomycetota bacterium]